MKTLRSCIFLFLFAFSLGFGGEVLGPYEPGETVEVTEKGWFVPDSFFVRATQCGIDLDIVVKELGDCKNVVSDYEKKDQNVKALMEQITYLQEYITNYQKMLENCMDIGSGSKFGKVGVYGETGFIYNENNRGSQYYGGGVILFIGK